MQSTCVASVSVSMSVSMTVCVVLSTGVASVSVSMTVYVVLSTIGTPVENYYGVATMSRRLKMIGLFGRISSLL